LPYRAGPFRYGNGEETAIRKLISLGVRCEVAFQLRQHSGDNTAHYFDWLITPPEGLLRIIRDDFPAFEPQNAGLRKGNERSGCVVDKATGVCFVHQFPRRGKLIAPDYLAHYPALNTKFNYLADRFRSTLRDHPVCFVRRDMTEEMALRLEGAMRARFPKADVCFLYVNAGCAPFITPLGHSVELSAHTTGLGDSLAWSKLLVAERLVERPFRLATAQVLSANLGDNHIAEEDRHPVEALTMAMRVNPQNPWFAHEFGIWALKRKKFRRAARLAEEALAVEPGNPQFIELRLRALLGARAIPPNEALEQVTEVLKLSPRSSLSALAAHLNLLLGQSDQSLALLSEGLARDPYNADLHTLTAEALFSEGRLAEAEAAINAALNLHPAGKALVALKAKILCARGEPEDALQLVTRTLRQKPSYRLRFLKARLALGLAWRGLRFGRLSGGWFA